MKPTPCGFVPHDGLVQPDDLDFSRGPHEEEQHTSNRSRTTADDLTGSNTRHGYKSDCQPTWCPGCGNYAVLSALDKALTALGRPPHDVAIVSGIGCSSRLPYFVDTYGIHGVHGRALPLATGLKVARPELTVIVAGGDGDAFSIGGNHFLHALRRNIDLTYIIMDNQIYGMTKGQASPTSDRGFVTKSSPCGTVERPVHPVLLAVVLGATYVAQGAAHDPQQLKNLILGGIRHHGLAVVNVLSPCRTFNPVNTADFYREACRPPPYNYARDDVSEALSLIHQADGTFPVGLLYQKEAPTFEDRLAAMADPIQHENVALKKLMRGYL